MDDPHNKHTIGDQGCSWATPLNNWLGAFFLNGFNKPFDIFSFFLLIQIEH